MIYKEYRCRSCGKVFSVLLREGERPVCPDCGSGDCGTNLSGGTCNRAAKRCSGNCGTCGGCR